MDKVIADLMLARDAAWDRWVSALTPVKGGTIPYGALRIAFDAGYTAAWAEYEK